MRAPVSIIIPTLDASATLGPALGALWEGMETGLIREVVVSDGGSDDATAEIARQAGAIWVTGRAGRGGQLARGAAAAGGEWLLFVHADTVLLPGWAAAARAHMRDHPDRAGWFRLTFDAPGPAPRWVACWANLRARLLRLPYGDQGLLVPRALYDACGGFPDIPLMEDVALARRIGRRMRPLDAVARTGAERYLAEGWFRRGARNVGTLARYLAGADPADLAARYGRGGPARR
ncbi:glycosyl transferase [Maritimibacter sp. 55A14]|uniref:TIGR04283 family arsenosugar biosynthesis glycosyltransferase n=1 Tax=Maritimibacter sp. 55A14 TaxID=2174844 RepID=UPI000D6065C2|nr:TIGR04283 family arsenosugar biosynthesis glycosyltransferase [Maritimibacter sp. 55A14]PWE32012.1 glycosyl transferase [Maritimibacter sp. 55A14]